MDSDWLARNVSPLLVPEVVSFCFKHLACRSGTEDTVQRSMR